MMPNGVLAGTVLGGRFALERRVGVGGMGEVYRALDRESGDVVAVKVMTSGIITGHMDRFAREARVLSELSHPNIVRYVAHGIEPQSGPYLAMEWLEGEDLAARLARAALTVDASLVLARHVADALHCAHQRGVIHRDIKPSNLFLIGDDPRSVKILDFGVARAAAGISLTGTGVILGTVGYMAPEQAGAGEVDARADLFSLGCVLYECLTGAPAFSGEHALAILVKLLHEDAPRLRALRPELPRALDELLASLLDRRPSARPRSAAVVASSLDAVGSLGAAAPDAPAIPASPSQAADEQRMVLLLLVDPQQIRRAELALTLVSARAAPTARHGELDTLVDLAPGPPDGTLAPEQVERHAAVVTRATARAGGEVTPLRNGTMLVTLPPRGSARDRAEAMALVARSIRGALPGARMALASARSDAARVGPLGAAVDRCTALLAAAGPGEVAVDETSARLLEERFVVDRAADREGFVLERERSVPFSEHLLLGKPMPCVGRGKEIALLQATIAECLNESLARSVLIAAPAGAGKSRLVQEVLRRIRDDASIRVLVARGDANEAGSSLAVLRTLVRCAAGLGATDDAEVARSALSALLREHAPDPDRACEFLCELIGRPLAAPRTPAMRAARNDPSEMRAWLERSFIDFVEALSAEGPLLLVLDDLHWADGATVAYVDEVLRRLHDRPLFVLAAGRPEMDEIFARPWRTSQRIMLDPLPKRASAELVRAALGSEVPDSLVQAVVERAQGNAFYLEEFVRAAADGRTELPETVQAMVEARLQTEAADARRVLRAASVFGEGVTEAAISALTDHAEPVARALLDGLVRAELLDRDRERPGAFVFRHAIVREVAYAMVPEGDRIEAHRRAARWLESQGENDAVALAEHYERAGEPAAAAEYLVRATELSYAAGLMTKAMERAERALASSALTVPQRARVQITRGAVLLHLRRFPEALAVCREAARGFPPGTAPWMRATAGVAVANFLTYRVSEALEAVDAITVETLMPIAPLGPAILNATLVLVTSGQQDRLRVFCDRVERTLTREAADPAFLAYAYSSLAYATIFVEPPFTAGIGMALRLADKAERVLEQTGSAQAQVGCRYLLSQVLWSAGQEQAARTKIEACYLEAMRSEQPTFAALARPLMALFGSTLDVSADAVPGQVEVATRLLGHYAAAALLLRQGALDEAERHAATLLEAAPMLPVFGPAAATILARIALTRGDTDRALAFAARAVEIAATRCANLRSIASAWECLADVHLARGEPQAAARVLDRARARILDLASGIEGPARDIFLAAEPYARLVKPG